MRWAFLFVVTAPQLVLCMKPPSKPVRKSLTGASKQKNGAPKNAEADKAEIDRILAKYGIGGAPAIPSAGNLVPSGSRSGGRLRRFDADTERAIAASHSTYADEVRARELEEESARLAKRGGKVLKNPLAAQVIEPMEEIDEETRLAIEASLATNAEEQKRRAMEIEEPRDHVKAGRVQDRPHTSYMRPGEAAAKANPPAAAKAGLSDYDFEAVLELSKNYVHVAPESEQVMRRGYPRILNLGSTCFVATAVQLLSHSKLVRDALSELPRYGLKNRAALAFLNLMDRIWQQPSRDQIINPEELVLELGFDPEIMQDSHEALSAIVDALSQVSPKIERMFAVQLHTTTTCQRCKHEAEEPQVAYSVLVPVPGLRPGETSVSLEECLFAGVGSNELPHYPCPRCKTVGASTRANFMQKTGDVLVLRLNRNGVGSEATPVEYTETLVLPTGEYDLIGVGLRSGNGAYSGHYWGHFRHPDDKIWVGANDKVLEEKHRPPFTWHEVSLLVYERRP